MKKIAYYITTHGLGHATRSVAIIRNLIKIPNLQIFVCSLLPRNYLIACFQSSSIRFHEVGTFFSIIYKDMLHVDIDRSIEIFNKGVETQEKYIERESEFCKKNNIDLIISDICPFPFDVAEKLKIPSIAISNFNWYSVFKHIINENEKFDLEKNLEILKTSYEKANILLRLPFNIDMDCFKTMVDVSLVVRKLSRDKNNIKNLLNLKEDDLIIFFGLIYFNFAMDGLIKTFNHLQTINEELKILFSSFLKPYVPDTDFFRFIPPKDQESQDFLAASDVVIGKVGYGTVSECIAYEKPLIYTTRKNYIEDIVLAKGIDEFGRGKYYPSRVLLEGKFDNFVPLIYNLMKKPIKRKLSINGTSEIFQFINEFI